MQFRVVMGSGYGSSGTPEASTEGFMCNRVWTKAQDFRFGIPCVFSTSSLAASEAVPLGSGSKLI